MQRALGTVTDWDTYKKMTDLKDGLNDEKHEAAARAELDKISRAAVRRASVYHAASLRPQALSANAQALRAITQAVRKRTWLRQLTLQRTTDTVRCCPCPPRRLPLPRIMAVNSISNPRHTKTKLSCATILPTSMKSWSTNVLIARRLRATHRTPVTNWRHPESEGIRTESPTRAI
jgi:hypothetical protein